MTHSHRAQCCCGQLSLTVEGPLPSPSLCHCHQCQKRTGSAFGLQARFSEEKVRIEGESTRFVRQAEGEVTLHFCPRCGSTVYWRLDGLPGSIIIAVGAFAGEAPFPPPVFSVYEDRMHTWLTLPQSITTHLD